MATTLMCWQVGGCRKLEAASSSYLATLASLVSMGGAIGSAVAGRTHAPLVCTRPYGMCVCVWTSVAHRARVSVSRRLWTLNLRMWPVQTVFVDVCERHCRRLRM